MKTEEKKSRAEGDWTERARAVATSAETGNALAVGTGLLFLGLCMALPLVGKAACGGSGSPGAGPMDTLGANMRFFWGLWVVTAAAGGASLANKLWRRKAFGEPFPKAVTGLLSVLVLLGLAGAAGWLKL
jgi:hypothetical protein